MLLVFSDDWGRHPSSCQYLTAELLPDADVLWVNTIGTRPPRLDWLTVRRGLEKVRSWAWGSSGRDREPIPAGLRVENPRMWPWVASPTARRINRCCLTHQLSPLLAQQQLPCVGLTTIPIAAVLLDALPVDRWVYYCVDDFSVWPGLDGETLLDLERQVVARADQIICASDTLAERIARLGRASSVITHGVDYDFWAEPETAAGLPYQVADPTALHAVFWGVVDRRLDTKWLSRLAELPAIGTITLVGPHQNPDPALLAMPKINAPGALPLHALPAVAAAADVLVMPYQDQTVTRAMQPLKLKEYLATGRPVVVRDLPATRPWADCCDVVASADDFVVATTCRAASGVTVDQQAARGRLVAESWQAKAAEFWPLVFGTTGCDRR